MRKTILSFLLLIPTSFLLSQTETPKHSFIGVDACSMCHKTEKQGKQLDIWKSSKHSQAFKVLQSAEADAIAKQKGFETAAAKTDACLKCHVSGYNVDASMKGEKFKMEDGVQCETCHGAGADYKNMKIMKSHDEAVANGLKDIKDVEAFCKTCHNPESPTFKEFNFTAAWDKIKHTVPKQ